MSPIRTLTSSTTQRVFLHCVQALSRPGLVREFEQVVLSEARLPEEIVTAALIPLSLCDLMTTLGAFDDDVGLAGEIAEATGTVVVPVTEARWVISSTIPLPEQLKTLARGVQLAPHHGATVSVQLPNRLIQTADGTADVITIRATGPGVNGFVDTVLPGVTAEFLAARAETVSHTPLGIDLLFVGSDNTVVGYPRTTRLEVMS